MKPVYCLLLLLLSSGLSAQNQAPVIDYVTANINWSTKTLSIAYKVTDAESDPLEISVFFSGDGGKTYNLTGTLSPTGDVGYPIQPGVRSITCDVSSLAAGNGTYTVRLVADDQQPIDIQQLVNQVDSTRLYNDLKFVEGVRNRTTGPTHLQAVRDSIKRLFWNAGLYGGEHTFALGSYTGRNLLGHQPGTVAPQKVVVVDAHYDTVNVAPGADDNGSGTVGMMEIARILSRYPSKKSLRYIGFDLEESGLVGSTRYVSNGIAAGEHIEGVLNFEMIGYYSEKPNSQTFPTGFSFLFPAAYTISYNDQFRGNFITNVGCDSSASLATAFQNAATQFVPALKTITIVAPGTASIAPDLRRSDHAPFWDAGIKAVMLTDGANFRNLCYHTAQDTLDNKLNMTFMSRVVQASLATAAQLAEVQHGSWATATFQNLVATDAPIPCALRMYMMQDSRNQLVIQSKDCEMTDVKVDIFDAKGAFIAHRELPVFSNETEIVALPSLTPGVYMVKIGSNTGNRKVACALR
jgi:hypothetical protein